MNEGRLNREGYNTLKMAYGDECPERDYIALRL